jgi:two-component system, sensor histidine kinase PdtaS
MMPAEGRPYKSRLAVRFALILALALLPAGFIAFVQTAALEREVRGRTEAALLGATLQAAAAETGLIGRVQGMVGALAAAIPHVADDPDACIALMDEVAAAEPLASVVALVPLSGLMTCSSGGRTYDYSEIPLFKQIIAAEAPYFWVNSTGPLAGTAVLGISRPVYDMQGTYIGYAVMTVTQVSLDALRYEALAAGAGLSTPAVFWTFDRNGQILTSNVDLSIVNQAVPATRALTDIVGGKAESFRATSVSGQRMTYAVVPLVNGELYLMSGFRAEDLGNTLYARVTPYLPTFLMWFVGLLGAAIAAEFLVTRYVRTLNRSMVSFARGDRRLEAIEMEGAPTELEELARAYAAMTESITRSEAELEDSIHQKEVLLREVHHRVKNNLQLISSIMNIQIRSARSGEARDLLKNLQERIMSLATVHRGLYQTSGLADVRARELIPDIVRQILAMSSGTEKPFETHNEIDDLRLVPDQAVPLSLLLAEALTNAIKHAGAARGTPGRLVVRLKRSGGSSAVLEVSNSTLDTPQIVGAEGQNTGIGSQLIGAFVQQLSGRQEVIETEGTYMLRVTFTVTPLSLAENRLVQDTQDTADWNASSP